MNENIINEINRLKFEDIIWIVFIIIALLNIYGGHTEIDYLKTNNNYYKNKADKIFEIVLIITFIIYIYFFIRNYNAYKKIDESKKRLYLIKVLGSSFLIAGVLCLLYFQINQTSFTGSPGI